ncbi:MAG: hypothetical protein Q9159_003216 [Coniocarpon cinnabarinum]
MKRSHTGVKRPNGAKSKATDDEEVSTEEKLAILASLFIESDTDTLLEALLAENGDVEAASRSLRKTSRSSDSNSPHKKPLKVQGYQSSLATFTGSHIATPSSPRKFTKKGRTLHLYAPEDVASHTPCSIIHNFLERDLADELLREMLHEAPTYGRDKFMLFDNTVESPHTICFYVDDLDDAEKQKAQYVYNGSNIRDVRKTLPCMRKVSTIVEKTVNDEIKRRIEFRYPDSQKLRFQSSEDWKPNTSFVNCYDGGKESVGWHSDQLTYLGPRPVIGSISLGVAREFRVRWVATLPCHFDSQELSGHQALLLLLHIKIQFRRFAD